MERPPAKEQQIIIPKQSPIGAFDSGKEMVVIHPENGNTEKAEGEANKVGQNRHQRLKHGARGYVF
jgi:hypothetical protein